MRILIVLAAAAGVAGAAEPTAPRPSSASKAWATRPAATPAPAETPAAAPAQAATDGASAATEARPAAAESSAATLEPRVQTSPPADAAAPASAAPAATTPATSPARTPAAAPRPATTAAAGGTRGVRDRLELETTQITGNRELPRVMYVVPWKSADLGDLAGRPVNSLLDEALTPVDRDVFRRQNRYYQALRPDEAR